MNINSIYKYPDNIQKILVDAFNHVYTKEEVKNGLYKGKMTNQKELLRLYKDDDITYVLRLTNFIHPFGLVENIRQFGIDITYIFNKQSHSNDNVEKLLSMVVGIIN